MEELTTMSSVFSLGGITLGRRHMGDSLSYLDNLLYMYITMSKQVQLGSLRSYYGDAEDNVGSLKNEFIFYQRISGYFQIINFVYHCQSYHETKSGTTQ